MNLSPNQPDLFDLLKIGFLRTDSGDNIVETNSYFTHLLGYTKEEILSVAIDRLISSAQLTAEKNEFQKLKTSAEKIFQSFGDYIHKVDGTLSVHVIGIYNGDNEKQYIRLVITSESKLITPLKNCLDYIYLDALLNSFPDAIYFKDINSRITKSNRTNTVKLGFKEEGDILGKTDFDIFSDEHAKQAYNDEQQIIKTGKPIIDIEEKETWPDGRVTWVSTSKMPLYDGQNKIIGIFGISRDITDQKYFEEELTISEERYKFLSEVAFEGILVHDKGIVLDANQAMLNLLGYTLDEIKGKNIIDLAIHEKSKELVKKNIAEGVITPYEITGVDKWGHEIMIELQARIMGIGNKNLRVVAVRDITERKRNEKIQSALFKISEIINEIDDMQSLYENIHNIIRTLMPADNFYISLYEKETDTLTFPYFVDKYDKQPEPRKFGKGLTEYVLRIDKDMLINAELDLELRDKKETDLLGEPAKIWLGVRLKIKDNVIGAIVLQDYENEKTYGEIEKDILIFVSEQIAMAIDKKRGEEKLKKYSDELKELVASKDKFFSIVAHDLKSPFSALLGYSEVIANEYQEMSKQELKEFAVNMNDVAKKTFSLLENLLEWSRIQTGRMKFNPENIGLFKITQQVVDLNYENAGRKGVILKNRVSPELEVYADQNMLLTILRNLISNAVKFTKNGDEVTISSKRKNEFIEITVEDTGVGMKDEDLEKLFRIDVHHSEIGTESETGTGLGLILCKELVDKNGGEIIVKSKLGKGSKFIFTVPYQLSEIY
ncbi:MAG: PAS domain S-box protein [Melioribacteraceae bacterium]|nr:PAS domain S-box protein [Melioribacteraceae bacterium]